MTENNSLGVVISFWPHFSEPQNVEIFWLLVFAAASIPFGVASTLKEKWMKHYDITLLHFLAWDAFFEGVFGLLLLPIVFISLPGRIPVAPSEFPLWVHDGFSCFFGKNVFGSYNCYYTWTIWLSFIFCNIAAGVLSLYLTKHVSAATAATVSATVIPVQTFLFLWPFLAGESSAEQLSWFTLVSLVVVVLGVVVYRARKEVKVAQITQIQEYVEVPLQGDQ